MATISEQLAAWRSSVGTSYVKTQEQLRAEYASMTFEQMRTRAGPPPNVSGCEFQDSSAREDRSGGGAEYDFDVSLSMFKKGQGPPPVPLYDDSRPEARMANVTKYIIWWNNWGNRLVTLWHKEKVNTKKSIQKSVGARSLAAASNSTNDTTAVNKRAELEVVCEQSGW
jgi:hypothetical protein